MEAIVELLAWVLFNIVFEFFGEFVLEFTNNLSQEDTPAPLAVSWFSIVGLAIGVTSVIVAATRVIKPGLFVGISVLVLPLLLGVLMEWWGWRRARMGRAISHLASWYGGGSLGLGLAVGRLGALAAIHGL